MADAGKDLILQLLDGMRRLEVQVAEMDRRITARLDNTNDTLTLIGGVVHRLTETVKERFGEHEQRLHKLEERP